MSNPVTNKTTGHKEFVFLMACMAALDAFSIDAMLPALRLIGDEFAVASGNQRQYVVTSLFLGFSIGVLIYGFVADQFGRRKPAMAGFLLFIFGSALCVVASSFPALLTGRVFQGLGAAGPYVLSVTIVRDQYEGDAMARTLSLIMIVFIGVPMIAPFVGQAVLLAAGWRSIFGVLLLFGVVTMCWFWMRQAETLRPEHRQVNSVSTIKQAVIEVFTNPQSLRYLLALAAAFGAFMTYLSTGQQVFQDIFQIGNHFPLAFASLASLFGVGSWLNARWVGKYGSARLVHLALIAVIVASALHFLLESLVIGSNVMWLYIAYMCVVMVSFAFLFGNLTSLALEPLGHIAGSASSLINSISTAIAILLTTLIGANLDQTVAPVVAGFGVLSVVALCLNYPQLNLQKMVPE